MIEETPQFARSFMPVRSISFLGSALSRGMALITVAITAGWPGSDIAADDRVADSRSVGVKAASNDDLSKATQQRIEELIRQLGNPRYSARRAAANELRQIGAEAFDLLHAASDDSDPEVAASARYLLRQISVRWVQSDDPAAVRAVLHDFGRESEATRMQRIQQLADLSENAGIAAICRIARYDRSPIVSRLAALAIIKPPAERGSSRTPVDPAVVEHELGRSTRAASNWLRLYLAQRRDPAAAVVNWQPLIDAETNRLEANAGDTSAAIVVGLLWNLADLHRQLGDNQAMIAVLDRMVDLDQQTLDSTAIGLLSWLTENKLWPVMDAFLAKHQVQFEASKRPLYFAALARDAQGKKEIADELAEKAAQLEPQVSRECLLAARELEERGQFEWSVREYRRAIEQQSLEATLSRIALANLLHDYEHYGEAADTIQPLCDDSPTAKQYAEIQQQVARRGYDLPEVSKLKARFHYYRGCQYREEKDWARARDSFGTAIAADPSDADVLIAMYRLPESDDPYREATRQRIQNLARQLQQEIDEKPNEASPYNQWAWLVSNTEGDFQKAIRYSHRSLELNTNGDSGAASYLDTLGRCYYAAGDFENAIKYQRQAIEKTGYMQVMHRQLALFEKALAEKQGARIEEQGTRKLN
jgi:tetratricopeptide (TPR) repeat protein